ncbi:MAG: GspH/FimT family pseudopilin [Phycisphaerae bacterium]|nr:GspH/FimT family pseudopilin [Phycisphaerae bacterium]
MMLSAKHGRRRAFTLIEIIVVVVIIAIAAFMAVPMLSSAADVQLRAAANMIAADIEYAKSLAITRQRPHSVVFDTANHGYEVQDQSATVVPHPLSSGGLAVSFSGDSRLNKVTIVSADFDGAADKTVTFDDLGSPYSSGTSPLVSGVITLAADGMTMTITIEPVTGYVTID